MLVLKGFLIEHRFSRKWLKDSLA